MTSILRNSVSSSDLRRSSLIFRTTFSLFSSYFSGLTFCPLNSSSYFRPLNIRRPKVQTLVCFFSQSILTPWGSCTGSWPYRRSTYLHFLNIHLQPTWLSSRSAELIMSKHKLLISTPNLLFLQSSSCLLRVHPPCQLLRPKSMGLSLIALYFLPYTNSQQSLLHSNPPAPSSFRIKAKEHLHCGLQRPCYSTPAFIWPLSLLLSPLLTCFNHTGLPAVHWTLQVCLWLKVLAFAVPSAWNIPSPNVPPSPRSLHDYANEPSHWGFPRYPLFKNDSPTPGFCGPPTPSLSVWLFAKAFYYPLTYYMFYLFCLFVYLFLLECMLSEVRNFVFLVHCYILSIKIVLRT